MAEPAVYLFTVLPLLKVCKFSSGYVPICCNALFVKVFILLVQLLFPVALGYVQQASVCIVLMIVIALKPHFFHDMYLVCTVCVGKWL